MLNQLNATLEEENKALVEQVNKLVEQVDITQNLYFLKVILGLI